VAGGTVGRWPLVVLRVVCYFAIAALVVEWSLTSTLGALRIDNARLTGQIDNQVTQINPQQATIDYLRSRWFGSPALWQPHGVPPGTAVRYFTVSGSTQADLEQSIIDANICVRYGGCLVDPAVPSSGALALESDGELLPNAQYCYTPATVAYHWSGHTIILPIWQPEPGTVPTALVEQWNALEQVLFVHEAGHVRVAIAWLAQENRLSQRQPTCEAMNRVWENPHLFDSLDAAQNAYHARLRANCRPELGCFYAGWMGWFL